MKKLLTLSALLFSLTIFSQGISPTDKRKWVYESTDDIRAKDLLISRPKDDGFSALQFWNRFDKPEQIAKIRSSGNDTLEITYPTIIKHNHLFKYIKVGNKIFREVEEEKPLGVYQWRGFPNSYLPIDTSNVRPRITVDTSVWDSVNLNPKFKLSIRYSDTSMLLSKHIVHGDTFPYLTSSHLRAKIAKIDSLENRGIKSYLINQLNLSSYYMSNGKKIKKYWTLRGDELWVLTYELWNSKKSVGIRLLKEERLLIK